MWPSLQLFFVRNKWRPLKPDERYATCSHPVGTGSAASVPVLLLNGCAGSIPFLTGLYPSISGRANPPGITQVRWKYILSKPKIKSHYRLQTLVEGFKVRCSSGYWSVPACKIAGQLHNVCSHQFKTKRSASSKQYLDYKLLMRSNLNQNYILTTMPSKSTPPSHG